jgi:hypothetical protein
LGNFIYNSCITCIYRQTNSNSKMEPLCTH